jgi:hypothetical protein
LMAFETARARLLLESGRPLARALPWRQGLELRGVLAGGHRILDAIEPRRATSFAIGRSSSAPIGRSSRRTPCFRRAVIGLPPLRHEPSRGRRRRARSRLAGRRAAPRVPPSALRAAARRRARSRLGGKARSARGAHICPRAPPEGGLAPAWREGRAPRVPK